MTQVVADLLEREPVGQQLRCTGMPQRVRPQVSDSHVQ